MIRPANDQKATHPSPITIVPKSPLLDQGDLDAKRQEILDYFHKSFDLYESIFECLVDDEAFYTRANPLRHPLIFYYGHTAVFFVNKLNVANVIAERIDPNLESILAIGVDEMSWDDLNESHYDWPTPAEVRTYRNQTREIVDRLIRNCDFSMPINWEDPMWIILMGIEHERIHLETTSVLIRELPLERIQSHPVWSRICNESGKAPDNELLPVQGGLVHMGKARDDSLYGWDNEYGQSETDVKSFRASRYLVSNQEFLAFVEDDGYQTKDFWTDEGWNWVQFKKATHPVYWVDNHGSFRYRAMLEEIDMPWDWPVDTNFLEAKAFCQWKSQITGTHIRMPTEAEWTLLHSQAVPDQYDEIEAPGNLNLRNEMSACPITRHAFTNGFFDVIGNVWQWTETAIDGFDGFETHPIYDDFSTPTFDGKHNLFKGGAWISTGNLAIRDSRYAFRRHFNQFSGLRYVEGDRLAQSHVNVYEEDATIAQYIEFHYGDTQLGVPNFPVACVQETLKFLDTAMTHRALDIGCAAGRSSFELAKTFDHVDAVDFSAQIIEAPTNLQKAGSQRYVIADEGELVVYKTAQLSNFNGYDDVKSKIRFTQGDACNLTARLTGYDLVFAGNLLDRLYDPARFLHIIQDRIREHGLLILISPYRWKEAFTPRDQWLGGYKSNTGESYTTLDGIADALQPDFQLQGAPIDIPFVIRETRRNFQHSISQMSVWKKMPAKR